MRKNILLTILSILVLLLGGCNKTQTLKCTKEVDSEGATIENTNTVNFKDKKLRNMTMEYNYILDDEYVKGATNIKNSIDKQFNNYKNYKGIKYTSKINDKKNQIYYKIEIDINKISDEAKNKLNITGDESYKANKKALKEAGFTCK